MNNRKSFFDWPTGPYAYVDSGEDNLPWVLRMFEDHNIDLFCQQTFDNEINYLCLHVKKQPTPEQLVALRMIFPDIYRTMGATKIRPPQLFTFKKQHFEKMVEEWPQFNFYCLDEINDDELEADTFVTGICFQLKQR